MTNIFERTYKSWAGELKENIDTLTHYSKIEEPRSKRNILKIASEKR